MTPKVGPWEGCRRQAKELSLRWAERACTRPMVTVLFPSPSGVGVMLEGGCVVTDRSHTQVTHTGHTHTHKPHTHTDTTHITHTQHTHFQKTRHIKTIHKHTKT